VSCLPSRLYAIVDTAQTGGRPLVSVIDAMLAGGVSVLQLRMKDRPADEFLRLALTARERTTRAGCLFIVNDRVDIALAARADGVHLGQDDLPLEAARPLVGEMLIGISTHSLEQAEAAERGGADYIGFGPMFPTRTKETGYGSRGVAMLESVRRRVGIPIVAIGGITADNVARTWNSGADAAAMISYLTQSDDITARVKEILDLKPSDTR
jgi:thiamine-phosphate pyrophosphorylase